MPAATPLFSIVIPTFNRAKLIKTAIDSVIAQTFTDWELVIVDDGSTDETRSVVAPYLEDARIRYHFQENKELNGARNTGIDLARGTYVCFLDDDDYYLEEHLEVLADFIEKNVAPKAIIRTGAYLGRGSKREELPNLKDNSISPIEFIWKNPVNLLSLAVHREIYQKYQFPEEFLNFDEVHLLFRALLEYPFYQIQDYTTVYVHHSEARTQNYWDEEKAANHFQAMHHLFEHFGDQLSEFITPKMQQEAVSMQHLTFANAAITSRNFKIAAKYIFRGMKGMFFPIWRNYAYTIALFFAKLLFNYPKR